MGVLTKGATLAPKRHFHSLRTPEPPTINEMGVKLVCSGFETCLAPSTCVGCWDAKHISNRAVWRHFEEGKRCYTGIHCVVYWPYFARQRLFMAPLEFQTPYPCFISFGNSSVPSNVGDSRLNMASASA